MRTSMRIFVDFEATQRNAFNSLQVHVNSESSSLPSLSVETLKINFTSTLLQLDLLERPQLLLYYAQ